eukprot:GHRR01005642.1.p1 GENE.GHRR01005642.1~~GHRR01005642.1.p1  ORF type:complete len:331 (+),score=135.99 GHRR01005642.1:598-1590(+)
MGVLEGCCIDTTQEIVALLDPSHVCHLRACSKLLAQTVKKRHAAVLWSRHRVKMQLRRARRVIRQRDSWVAYACKLQQLAEEPVIQDSILHKLQKSPDGIRDLAAAVQQALGIVTHQTFIQPAFVKHVREDLVRFANFVCLLAWRIHLRSRRAARQAAATTAGHNSTGVQQLQQHAPAVLPQAPITQEQATNAQPVAPTQAQAGLQQQQQQQLQNVAAPQQPATAATASTGTQTDLGPSIQEMDELMTGLKALMQPGVPTLKPCKASLNLLDYCIQQQLQAWNLQGQQEPAAGAGAVADAVVLDDNHNVGIAFDIPDGNDLAPANDEPAA